MVVFDNYFEADRLLEVADMCFEVVADKQPAEVVGKHFVVVAGKLFVVADKLFVVVGKLVVDKQVVGRQVVGRQVVVGKLAAGLAVDKQVAEFHNRVAMHKHIVTGLVAEYMIVDSWYFEVQAQP